MCRFTIRELVLLTVIVAMGVGWWVDRRRLEAIAAEHDASSIRAWDTVAAFAKASSRMRQAIEAHGLTLSESGSKVSIVPTAQKASPDEN